jgi:hypothetical protein
MEQLTAQELANVVDGLRIREISSKLAVMLEQFILTKEPQEMLVLAQSFINAS